MGVLLCAGAVRAGEVQRTTDPRTGIERVQVEHPGFSLELVPLNPDFVVAVFSSRGLPPEVLETTRGYCFFGTILRNTGTAPLTYDLTEWRYVTKDGKVHHVRPKTRWLEEWAESGVPFRWLLLHEAQTYQPGDWGQGFTTVPLPAGTRFDLHYSWLPGGERHEGIIEDFACAPPPAP